MSLTTYKGATQRFTLHLTVPEGQSITPQHTVLWMVKKNRTDPDEEAVLTRRLSDGSLIIDNDGSANGEAELSGELTAPETLALFGASSSSSVTFVTEVRVVTPNNRVQPRFFAPLTIQDTVIDQIVHDSELD